MRKPLKTLSPEVAEQKKALADDLKELSASLGDNPKSLDVSSDAMVRLDEAERMLENWAQAQYRVDLVGPWARRLAEYISRLSIVFTASEGATSVDVKQILRAVAVVDRARSDALFIVGELSKGQATRRLDRYEKYVSSHPGVTLRELQRATGDTAKEVVSIMHELTTGGRIRAEGGAGSPRQFWAAGTVKSSGVGPSGVGNVG